MIKIKTHTKVVIVSLIIIGLAVLTYHKYKEEIIVFWELDKLKDDNSEYYYKTDKLERREITIPNDSDIDDVIDLLNKNGELKGVKQFKALADVKKYTNNIVYGTIILKGRRYSIDELINSLKIKKRETTNLQILENIRLIEDMIVLLEDSVGYKRGELKSYLETSNFLQTNDLTMETLPAFFIPNTYELYSDISVEEFLNKMSVEYQKFWNPERESKLNTLNLNLHHELILDSIPDFDINQQTQSPDIKKQINKLIESVKFSKIDVSILASIIEEEQDRRIEERPIIAGLYLKRIKDGMKLQSDPTVIFANNDFTITRVLKNHLKYASPYNTYIHNGLPPGPICIPSINSIDAVLNAEPNDYIFMCGKGDGSGLHNFAITLREHNNNKKIFKRNVGFN